MIIIADLKSFTLAHKVFVVDNDNVVASTQTNMKDMSEVICELAHTYNPTKVILSGNKKYTADMKNKIQHTFAAKFACDCPFEIE